VFVALVCQLCDDDDDDADASSACDVSGRVRLHGAVACCSAVGQLATFLLFSFTTSPTPPVLCLVVLLPVAVFGFLAAEIHLRLADGETAWSGGRVRRRYVAVTGEEEGTSWLPRYDPLESPRKDRVRPLFDDRSPRYVVY